MEQLELNTPNMDFLANNLRKFTNGYATSICTPSRYALEQVESFM